MFIVPLLSVFYLGDYEMGFNDIWCWWLYCELHFALCWYSKIRPLHGSYSSSSVLKTAYSERYAEQTSLIY
jgi:hypothetical protein